MAFDNLLNWVVVPEAARHVGVAQPNVHARVRRGKLKGLRLNGKSWVVERAGLEQWIRERRARGVT